MIISLKVRKNDPKIFSGHSVLFMAAPELPFEGNKAYLGQRKYNLEWIIDTINMPKLVVENV